MKITEQIREQLPKLGLTSKESIIYVDMLTNGNNNVRTIAQSTGINRVTVHSAIEQLINKELVDEGRDGRKRILAANPPNHLLELVKNRQQQVNQMLESALSLSSLIENLPRSDYSIPSISVYKGVRGLKRLLESTISSKSTVKIIIDISQLRELLSEGYLMDFYRRRAKKNVYSQLIWPQGKFTEKVKKSSNELKMEIKTLKGSKNWKVGIFSWDDILVIKSLTRGNLVCTVIRSREIADFYQKIVFNSIWSGL